MTACSCKEPETGTIEAGKLTSNSHLIETQIEIEIIYPGNCPIFFELTTLSLLFPSHHTPVSLLRSHLTPSLNADQVLYLT